MPYKKSDGIVYRRLNPTISDDLYQRLERRLVRRQTSMSEAVRQGLELWLMWEEMNPRQSIQELQDGLQTLHQDFATFADHMYRITKSRPAAPQG